MIENFNTKVGLMQEELIKKIPRLNSGGCIHFAYYFALRLKELEIPHELYLFDWQHVGITYETFEPVSHVVIKVNGRYIDGHETTFEKHNKYKRKVKLDPFYLKQYKGWNPTYKKRQNSTLQQIINKFIR